MLGQGLDVGGDDGHVVLLVVDVDEGVVGDGILIVLGDQHEHVVRDAVSDMRGDAEGENGRQGPGVGVRLRFPGLRVGGEDLKFSVPLFRGLMRRTTIAQGRFSPWEGRKENRNTLQNTI